jgi:pimeloyl-ACP methyl ester carboxylesterase
MLCLLGDPAVLRNGVHEPLRLRPKALALTARLALAGGPVERTELARMLFPDAEDPRRALRWHLADLRRHLPDEVSSRLEADHHAAALRTDTDVAAFRAGAQALLGNPGSAGAAGVLRLYRGDLCVASCGSPDHQTWLYVEQEALRRLFRRCTVAHARAATTAESRSDAIAALGRLIAVDPYFEDGHVLLIEALESLGRYEAARSSYETYERMVRRELQAEPRPALARRFGRGARPGRALPEEDLVPLREVTLHVVDWPGDEPAVLAIHGSAGSAYSLTGLGERLAPVCRVVAMDLRGHGFSDKPPAGYDLAAHVRDVGQLIDALGLVRPVVLGFSLGGPVAAAAAAAFDVGGLVLLEGAIGDRMFLTERGAQSVDPTEATLELRFRDVDEYLEMWRAQNPRYSDEAERWLDRFARYELARLPDGRLRRRGLGTALRAEFQSVLETDTLGILERVRCPALIVRGALPWMGGDPWLPDAIWEAQVRACPHAEQFVAWSSNHASLVRDPEEDLVAAIVRFVRSPARRALGAGWLSTV